jgi:hypothetical protein
MIIGLTFVLMIVFTWSIFSIGLCFDSADMGLDYDFDGLLVTIAKIYWWAIGIFVCVFVLFFICYLVSAKIVCSSKHNDYPVCERINTNGE